MSQDSKKIEILEMKMEAMKKVYSEVILNASKEAAARVMSAERKALGFNKELVFLREDYARMMLHLNNSFKSQIQEAEAKSLNQQKKIDELEAQLGEAEGIIVDLRDELKVLHEKLATLTNNTKRPSNGYIAGRNEPIHECQPQDLALSSSIASPVSDAKAALVEIASIHPIGLNFPKSVGSVHVMDNCSSPGKSNLVDACYGSEESRPFIMQTEEADFCRNDFSQTIHASESKLSINDTQCLVDVLVETTEAVARENSQYPVTKKPCIINNSLNMNSVSYSKDQTIRTPRRSAEKNTRYREAIASLRGKSRKKYVKKLPLNVHIKACSSHLNLQSGDVSPKSEVMNNGISGGVLDIMVSGEGRDGPESREALNKKTCLTSVRGLLGPDLVEVPISESFGSFHQVEKFRPLKLTYHRKCRKNVLRKLDENIVPVKYPVKRKLARLTDVSVVESHGLDNGFT